MKAREIEDIGLDNGGNLSQPVTKLYDLRVSDIEQHRLLVDD